MNLSIRQRTQQRITFVIFFSDPLQLQPHEVDVKALLQIAVVHNMPIACNRATADFVLSSPLMETEYMRQIWDYGARRKRHWGLFILIELLLSQGPAEGG